MIVWLIIINSLKQMWNQPFFRPIRMKLFPPIKRFDQSDCSNLQTNQPITFRESHTQFYIILVAHGLWHSIEESIWPLSAFRLERPSTTLSFQHRGTFSIRKPSTSLGVPPREAFGWPPSEPLSDPPLGPPLDPYIGHPLSDPPQTPPEPSLWSPTPPPGPPPGLDRQKNRQTDTLRILIL